MISTNRTSLGFCQNPSPYPISQLHPPGVSHRMDFDGSSSILILLLHGSVFDFVCLQPSLQLLHIRPVTPSLQGHCPVAWSQIFPLDPCGWQSHSKNDKNLDISRYVLRVISCNCHFLQTSQSISKLLEIRQRYPGENLHISSSQS